MKLFKIDENDFVLITNNNRSVSGNKIKIIATMFMIGIDEDEIYLGMDALDNGDQVSEYGIYNTFIFSKKIA